jgi:hypothetical protein
MRGTANVAKIIIKPAIRTLARGESILGKSAELWIASNCVPTYRMASMEYISLALSAISSREIPISFARRSEIHTLIFRSPVLAGSCRIIGRSPAN